MEKLTFIELEIQNENAQEVFESLNSTGLSLTNVDLLRNYLLMQYDYSQQTYLYDRYWSEIETNVGPAEMENFFVDYLICRRKGDSAVVAGRNAHINEELGRESPDFNQGRNCRFSFLLDSKYIPSFVCKKYIFRPCCIIYLERRNWYEKKQRDELSQWNSP